MTEGAHYVIGQMVGLRADPSRRGPVIAQLPAVAGRPRYRVYHGPNEIRAYYEDQLIPVDQSATLDAFAEALANGQGLDARTFRSRLTAARLAHPLTDNLYALHAARIRSIPFQFKPLLRFLRADQPRLLISDDVGVGKTIEAGLVLKELETRQELDSVIVVCPKALVPKWRMEMRRFDEDFHELTPDSLRYCLQETAYDGAWPEQFRRAVVPLELLRGERYLRGVETGRRRVDGLLTLDPPPRFGLLIVDEAHHLRNTETSSHALARFLCDVSEAVLFLTATPVHLGAQDLYSLLNLLRPDLFRDEDVFNVMVEPNRYITQAMRHLRAALPRDRWQTAAAEELRKAARTEWGQRSLQSDPRFASWLIRIGSSQLLDDSERVRALRDLEEVHSLALVMNRTRRRDIGAFTVREPHTVAVAFTPEQERFYVALIDFRRQMLQLQYGSQVASLIVDTLERQASSCLPALVPAIDAFLQHGRFGVTRLTDIDDGIESEDIPADVLLDRARELRQLAVDLPDEDPKRDRFLTVVGETMASSGPRKVLVFSFFLHTLAYLERQLRHAGYRVGVVTGRVPDEEREYLRGRFRLPFDHPDAIDILLSSEVGCEGLDYEFCDCLVNYDLPWNPMRIEQRIGRIDRFGQRSEKILIFNFITPGTVEERIFHRCFTRLGIFSNTVGDLEEVLGELVQDLTRLAFDPSLSLEQAEARAHQLADNAVRLAEERRRLEEEGGILLGVERALEDEVRDLLDDGRFVSTDELRTTIEAFLATPAVSGRLAPDDRNRGIHHLRLTRDGRRSLARRVRSLSRGERVSVEFQRWLDGEETSLAVTFEQDLALERRDLPFITPVHPLAKIAVADLIEDGEPLVASLRVTDTTVPAGRYLFTCELWETVAVRKEVRLIGFALDLAKGALDRAVSQRLLPLLAHASKAGEWLDRNALSEGFRTLDEAVHAEHQRELRELRDRNILLLNQRLASLETYHRQRMDRVRTDLSQATEPRIQRMRRSELERVERDYERLRSEMETRRDADIIGQPLAAGILLVRGKASANAE